MRVLEDLRSVRAEVAESREEAVAAERVLRFRVLDHFLSLLNGCLSAGDGLVCSLFLGASCVERGVGFALGGMGGLDGGFGLLKFFLLALDARERVVVGRLRLLDVLLCRGEVLLRLVDALLRRQGCNLGFFQRALSACQPALGVRDVALSLACCSCAAFSDAFAASRTRCASASTSGSMPSVAASRSAFALS